MGQEGQGMQWLQFHRVLLLLVLQARQDSTLAAVLYNVHLATALVAEHLGQLRISSPGFTSRLSPRCPFKEMLSLVLVRFFWAMEGIEGEPLAARASRIFFRVALHGSSLGRGWLEPLIMSFPFSPLAFRMSINIKWILLLTSGARQRVALMAVALMKMPTLPISSSFPW
jgi:hypothetical protein